MAPPLLKLDDIHLTFGGTPLLTGAGLVAGAGDRICLVGRNGSGKSTLLKVAAGLLEPDRGERFLHPAARVRYLSQETDFAGFDTTLACVEAALGPADDRHSARRMLEALELTGDEDPSRLSGGEARRVALAAALAAAPELLLLDEPTNHLDLPAIEWLEEELLASKAGIVLVSHDRRFLERLSRTTVWLDRGATRVLGQGFARFEDWRDELLEREAEEAHKLDRRIAREMDWMHSGGVTARRKRNVRRAAELRQLRTVRREARAVVGNVRMEASEAETSGRLVAELDGVCKSYGDGPLIERLSLRIMRGDRLALVGPNGVGKTTLLTILLGELAPDAGSVRLGSGFSPVVLDQRRDTLEPEAVVADTLTGGRGDYVTVNGVRRHVASYLADFLFQPEQARSPVRVLSGGERGRLMLARALARPSNLLVLDEPTNDLDLETLDLLQELLADYPGTILLVSHDRDFLDRVATSVLAAEGRGRWIEYAGGYSDMLAQRQGAARTGDGEPPPVERRAAVRHHQQHQQAAGEAARRKLSFKEKHALATLPTVMERLAGEIAAAERRLADPGLFGRDPKAFAAVSRQLAALQQKLAAAEDEWLELEVRREELEG
jgi:ATP-binding cassette subfamily F protein uup